MKKLVQAVKTSLPALAEAMETLRANMVVFRYQLHHISRGKYKLGQYLDAAKPTLAEYLAVVQKIKNAVKERKSLLTEKREISFWNIPKAKELNAKIAELTEDIEELKSEKSVLLDHLNCTDDAGISVVKKDIAAAEAGLSKLEQQKKKYSEELEATLSEYAVLKEQSAGFDSTELYAQRMELRSVKTADASHRIQSAYGEKYDPLVMFDSKRDVTELLHKENESRACKQRLKQQKQRKQLPKQREKRNHERQER